MKTNEVIKGNILIAEFMGLKIITDEISFFDTDYKPLKKYDSDWNSLMPVVEKINLINDFKYSVSIYTMDCYIENKIGVVVAKCECQNNPDELITSVFNAIVDFINWYNKK